MKKKINKGQKPCTKNKMEFLALITKHRVPFIIIMELVEDIQKISKEEIQKFDTALDTLYHNKKGTQPKGIEYSRPTMMRDFRIVKLTMEDL